jgi:hypothetical protein
MVLSLITQRRRGIHHRAHKEHRGEDREIDIKENLIKNFKYLYLISLSPLSLFSSPSSLCLFLCVLCVLCGESLFFCVLLW